VSDDRGSIGGGWSLDLTTDAKAPKVDLGRLKVNHQKRSVSLKFSANDNVATSQELAFMCKLDKKRAKPCSSPVKYKRLKFGKHKVKVTAVDQAGNRDTQTKKFKLKRR
jgi:hypothetical protein